MGRNLADPHCLHCGGSGKIRTGDWTEENCACVTRNIEDRLEGLRGRLRGLRDDVQRLRSDPREQARRGVQGFTPVKLTRAEKAEAEAERRRYLSGEVTYCCEEPVCTCGRHYRYIDGVLTVEEEGRAQAQRLAVGQSEQQRVKSGELTFCCKQERCSCGKGLRYVSAGRLRPGLIDPQR